MFAHLPKMPFASKLAAFALASIALLTGQCATATSPNVLLIAVDDLNDWIGCLAGHPQVKTPHLDRLARRGVLFANAHCQSPLCNPSRTSVMTGLRPSTTGVYALEPWFRDVGPHRDWVTLPQYFQKHGYRTLSGGKIYHRPSDRVGEVERIGPAGGPGPLPRTKFVTTPQNHLLVDWGPYPERDEDQADYQVATWAIEELKKQQNQQQPFFMAVGFFRPHVPCYASPKWFELYPEGKLTLAPFAADDRDDTPRFSWYLHWKLPEPRRAWLEREQQLASLTRAYLANVSFVDSQIGRVLDALDQHKLTDHTIVVLWSDHGFHLGEKGISGKNSLWDPATRVPLMFAGPGVAHGQTCRSPAELLDIYPTLAELCKLPQKEGLEGQSLVPQLNDVAAPRDFPAITSHGPGNHAVRTEKWRFIRYADGAEELYDIGSDPEEFTNLAAKPEYNRVRQELAKWLPMRSAAPLPGSKSRLIELKNGRPYWEQRPIADDEPIPSD